MARDRVLNDLGASFVQLGVYSAARDAYLVVAATAQEQYMRWTAMINLLDVAADERREPVFEQYRRDLEGVGAATYARDVLLHTSSRRVSRVRSGRRSRKLPSSARSSFRLAQQAGPIADSKAEAASREQLQA